MSIRMKTASIRIDGGTQPRVSIDTGAVEEYSDALNAGAKFPPVVVFHDGADYWLADGFHRWHAHKAAGEANIEVDLREGTKDDATLFSLGANSAHGLRRSNADKRRAVEIAIRLEQLAGASDRKLAEVCSVHHRLVADVRRSLEESSSEKSADERVYTTKHGTEATMKTSGINAGREKKKTKEEARAANWDKDKPADAADVKPEDAFEGFDPVEELAKTQAELTAAQERIEALTATDQGAELDKQMRLKEQAEARADQLQTTSNQMQKELNSLKRFEDQLRQITGKKSRAEILEAVKKALAA